MKKFIFLLFVFLLVASGCGKEEAKTADSVAEEVTEEKSEAENSNEIEVVNSLSLEKQIDQLGGESFSEEGLNEHSHIADIDGYTYVLTPAIFAPGYSNASAKLYVSILKDDKFIIKEKVVDLTETIGVGFITNYFEYDFNQNSFLVTATTYDQVSMKYIEKIISVSINETGDSTSKVIKEANSSTPNFQFIDGLEGSYFKDCLNNQCNILDSDGNTLYTFKTGDLYNDKAELFFDEQQGRVYFNDKEPDTTNVAFAYDIKVNDMVWNTDGTEMLYTIPTSKSSYIGENNGFYVLHTEDTTEHTLYYYSNVNGEPTENTQVSISSSLETEKVEDNDLTLDEKYINVYRNVIYKGKPALQKYSYTRMDKSDEPAENKDSEVVGGKEDKEATGENGNAIGTKDLSSYTGVWVHHFEEGNENSGGYFVTLSPFEGSTESFNVEVKEMTPGATFINGSESVIGLDTGKGFYEFMEDANGNSGMVEIELAGNGIIYRKKMYTNNPGRFNEDIEVKITQRQ